MSCGCPSIPAPSTPYGCVPASFCPPENFGLNFPSLVGPQGPPGGSGTYVPTYALLRLLNATVFPDGYIGYVAGRSAIDDGGEGQFVYRAADVTADNDGTILRPSNGIGRWFRIFNGPVEAPWFGANPASLNNLAAIQAAVNAAPSSVHLPGGLYATSGSLDFTNCVVGLIFFGDGAQTQIHASGAGKCVIDCTGKDRLVFENFWIVGEAAAPDAAFLFARKSTNGSAGLHTLRNLKITGTWAKACVVSISSEVNVYDNVTLDNTSLVAASGGLAITAQNDLGVTSDFQTFPVTFTGGNTVHKWIAGVIDVASLTGIQVLLNDVRDISFHGTFFSLGGVTGIQCTSVNSLHLLGCSSEWAGTYGIRVMSAGAGTDLVNSTFRGTFNKGVYGENNSTLRNCEFWGPFFQNPSFSVYNMYNCIISNRGLGATVRNDSQGNKYIGANDCNLGAYTLPALSRFDQIEEQGPCSDGKTRGYAQYCNDSRSRFLTHFLMPKGILTQTQSPTFASPLTVQTDLGCAAKLVLTGNLVLNDFNIGDWQPGATHETDGLEFTFVFQQDGTGGRTVTFPVGWKINWTPDTTAGKTNVLVMRYYGAPIGAWCQVSEATGL